MLEDESNTHLNRTAGVRSPGRLGGTVQLIGDDLFATQPAGSAGDRARRPTPILIKLNQVGTLSETFDTLAPGPPPRLPRDHLGPLRRDRRHHHRRPRRGHRRRSDQDRLGRPFRAARQIQPPAPHRGAPRARTPTSPAGGPSCNAGPRCSRYPHVSRSPLLPALLPSEAHESALSRNVHAPAGHSTVRERPVGLFARGFTGSARSCAPGWHRVEFCRASRPRLPWKPPVGLGLCLVGRSRGVAGRVTPIRKKSLQLLSTRERQREWPSGRTTTTKRYASPTPSDCRNRRRDPPDGRRRHAGAATEHGVPVADAQTRQGRCAGRVLEISTSGNCSTSITNASPSGCPRPRVWGDGYFEITAACRRHPADLFQRRRRSRRRRC